MKRKLCIVTGTRAEYELLKPLMEFFNQDPDYELQIIATGMHLSPEFGLTVQMIEQDKLPIADKIEMLLSADTDCAIAKSTGLGIISFADSLRRIQPDLLLVLGDRFETLSAVIPAFMMKIPTIHLHGGETTKGAFDEGFRHAITKMSYLHFTASEEYRARVIQLGENPNRVFNVGSIGVENIKKLSLLQKKDLEKELNFKFRDKNLLVTFHPVTLENRSSEEQFRNLLTALSQYPDWGIIFTKANADTAGRIINRMIDEYVALHPSQTIAFTTMGQLKYFSTMQYVDALIGNTSSGIFEAPSFKIGTINIGDRQTGRLKPKSVIDCDAQSASIEKALTQLVSSAFQNTLKQVKNPYEQEETAKRIYEKIKSYSFDPNSMKKEFYDIEFKI